MSFFNPEIPIKQKLPSKHPWEHRIKAKFFDRYKYTHNSVQNPLYPLPKNKHVLGTKPVKFIVIGNRVTREFIYCYHVVRALYKHRKKEFEAPIIRGVTSVEWPKVWHDLKMQFGIAAYCIESQVAVLINNQFLGGENEFRTLIQSKYVYHYPECLDYYKEGIEQFTNYVKSNGRPCAYLHISINDIPIGPLIFMLYADIVPLTCQNFLKLCELKKNGYAGAPIHRIVQDSWIQCGGFTLKNPTELDCENYIVPHDRRGVLAMANAGRNQDCSTQFFVLLQPADWMTHKYVAFGQLIEGEGTLKKIEGEPTWHESPTAKITIYKAGVFNVECHWRPINKTATDYISGHIEDLFQIGKLFYEMLLEKVYAVIEERKEEEAGEEEEDFQVDVVIQKESSVRATKSFKRNKEDIEKELIQKSSRYMTPASSEVNNDFDVEEYEKHYEEEEMFPEQSIAGRYRPETPESSKVLEQPYYLPLTDVPYPGEVQSTFNLQRLLRGDYCHETDLVLDRDERKKMFAENKESITIPDDLLDALFECVESEEEPEGSLLSDDETEIREYIKENVDTTSFAGPIIKKVANIQDKYEILQDVNERKKKNLYTDEDLRLLRVATKKLHSVQRKRVSINKNTPAASHTKIHRRQTGFVRPEQIQQLEEILEELREKDGTAEKESEAMRYVGLEISRPGRSSNRFQTGHEHSSDTQSTRKSVLLRLYQELSNEELKPTLKTLSEKLESQEINHYPYLTRSVLHTTLKESDEKFFIPRNFISRQQVEETLDIQHGSKLCRKVSSDYANTLQHFDERTKSSIRSVEYAKNRPSISVVEYKMLNQKYQEQLKASKDQLEANNNKSDRTSI
ncbi:unnamed protein product [Arctia plantaginis]|uniref:PPIase cyclophilin-type domain-containing protein n=1 Tax=Arctia plantaginis TaxID=874455 RepID=A0A8S0YRX7_ARCPL|nr:unnamed protein product [Arctia plantaginis]